MHDVYVASSDVETTPSFHLTSFESTLVTAPVRFLGDLFENSAPTLRDVVVTDSADLSRALQPDNRVRQAIIAERALSSTIFKHGSSL